jgi:hypothetical protein
MKSVKVRWISSEHQMAFSERNVRMLRLANAALAAIQAPLGALGTDMATRWNKLRKMMKDATKDD